jgi:hypothetical protein
MPRWPGRAMLGRRECDERVIHSSPALPAWGSRSPEPRRPTPDTGRDDATRSPRCGRLDGCAALGSRSRPALGTAGSVAAAQWRARGCKRGRSWVPGAAIASMRERAAEVGGTLEIVRDHDGTLVHAVLPTPFILRIWASLQPGCRQRDRLARQQCPVRTICGWGSDAKVQPSEPGRAGSAAGGSSGFAHTGACAGC